MSSIAAVTVVAAVAMLLAGCRHGSAGAPTLHITPAAMTHPAPGAPGLFADVASASGISFTERNGASGEYRFVETTPGGCAFLDFDRDGRLDVLLVQSGPVPGAAPVGQRPRCALYRNDGNHTAPHFTDVTKEAGLDHDFGYLQGVAVADYDNDGYPDIYLTAYGGNHLLHNDGRGHFVDVTAASGLGDTDQGPRWATSAAWGDFDNDGLLDLYVCHYCVWSPATDLHCVNRLGQRAYCTPNQYEPDAGRLYKNLGGGRFRDVTREAGLAGHKGRGLGAVWLDYDGDGRQDLYVANDLTPNLLFHNVGGGRFEEVGLRTEVAYSDSGEALSGMGIAVGDYDGDGREDLYVTNFSGQTNSLFHNSGSGAFHYSTTDAHLAAPTFDLLGWGVAFLDYDNDGWLDLVVGNGHVNPDIEQTSISVRYWQPKGLYRNNADGTFTDEAPHRGDMSTPRGTRGLAIGDFDNDGRVDVLANNQGQPAELFQNRDKDAGAFLTIRLVGTRSNRDGIGTRIRLTVGGRTLTRVCRRSFSFLSSSDPRVHFGLGAASRIERIEILWPSGHRDVYQSLNGRPLPANTFLAATEGRGLSKDAAP